MKHSFSRLAVFTLLALAATPYARGQWVQTNGQLQGYPDDKAFGGSISAIIVSGKHLIVSTSGGVFLTSNSGKTWISSDGGALTFAILDGFLFAGTGGLYRSTDDGFSWHQVGALLADIYGLAECRGNLFAVVDAGISRSTDTGKSWTWIDSLASKEITCIATKGTLLFAGSSLYGIYRSTDNGLTWSNLPGLQNSRVQSLYVSSSGDVFAGAGGIFKSTDDGNTWIESDSGIDLENGDDLPTVVQSGGSLVASVGSGVYYSTNAGSSWHSTWLHGVNFYSSELGLTRFVCPMCAANGKIYVGTNRGLFVSTDDGVNWAPMNVGLRSLAIYDLVANGGTLFASSYTYSSTPMLMRSTDDGASWFAADVGFDGPVQAMIFDRGNLLIGASPGVFRSSDNGTHWEATSSGLASRLTSLRGVQSFAAINGSLLATSTDSGLFRSTDGGDSWTTFNANLPSLDVHAVSNNHGVLFASLWRGICRSTDAGASWTPLVFPDTQAVNQFCGLGKTIFAVTDHGIMYRSSDDGDNWIKVDTGLGFDLNGTMVQVGRLTEVNGALFVGTSFGAMYVSTDTGKNWLRMDPQYLAIWDWQSSCTDFAACDGYIFVGNTDRGVWRRPLSDFGIQASVQARSEWQHIACYPNPLTSTTTITLSSPAVGFAEITVVNLLGVEVARVFAGAVDAGEHSVTWQKPSGLPAGMYECIVRMNGHAERVGMIVE